MMIRPPYPFPKRWKRIYGETTSRNVATRDYDADGEENDDRVEEEEKEEEFVPIPLFREGEWVGCDDDEEEEVAETVSSSGIRGTMVLSEEWQERFRRTAEKREKRKIQESLASSQLDDDNAAEFSELSSKENEERARELYGEESGNQILLLEAALNAQFDRLMDKNNPVLWPEIPIDAIRGRS